MININVRNEFVYIKLYKFSRYLYTIMIGDDSFEAIIRHYFHFFMQKL